jgi:hypothetical protein
MVGFLFAVIDNGLFLVVLPAAAAEEGLFVGGGGCHFNIVAIKL